MPVAEGSENRFEPYEDVAAGQHAPGKGPGFAASAARDVVMLVSAASGEGASIGYQTLWVAPAMLRPANTSPIRASTSFSDRSWTANGQAQNPIGPTTDIELKDKGSESRCGYIPNAKEDSDAQAQKPPPNYA